jgi:hypothetical protein
MVPMAKCAAATPPKSSCVRSAGRDAWLNGPPEACHDSPKLV